MVLFMQCFSICFVMEFDNHKIGLNADFNWNIFVKRLQEMKINREKPNNISILLYIRLRSDTISTLNSTIKFIASNTLSHSSEVNERKSHASLSITLEWMTYFKNHSFCWIFFVYIHLSLTLFFFFSSAKKMNSTCFSDTKTKQIGEKNWNNFKALNWNSAIFFRKEWNITNTIPNMQTSF